MNNRRPLTPGGEFDQRLHPVVVKAGVDGQPGFQLVFAVTELFHQEPGQLLPDALVIGVRQDFAGEIILQFTVDDMVSRSIDHGHS